MPEILFDAELHRYTVDGEEKPGINRILRESGIVGEIPDVPAVRIAIEKGRIVHSYLEIHDKGDLGMYEVDPAVIPYLDGWKEFLTHATVEPGCIEKEFYCATYDYCTKVDRIVTWKGEMWVVNIKTGKPMPHYGIQMAAESVCCGVKPRLGVFLDGAGGYEPKVYEDEHDFEVWKAACTIYQWKHSGRKRRSLKAV